VFPDVQYDPEIIALYKEEAEAHGMYVSQYLSQCDFPTADIAYKYHHGTLSSDSRRFQIYQQDCQNCISGIWKPQRMGRTGLYWELMMSITFMELTT
jgi:hypothetical protein